MAIGLHGLVRRQNSPRAKHFCLMPKLGQFMAILVMLAGVRRTSTLPGSLLHHRATLLLYLSKGSDDFIPKVEIVTEEKQDYIAASSCVTIMTPNQILRVYLSR